MMMKLNADLVTSPLVGGVTSHSGRNEMRRGDLQVDQYLIYY